MHPIIFPILLNWHRSFSYLLIYWISVFLLPSVFILFTFFGLCPIFPTIINWLIIKQLPVHFPFKIVRHFFFKDPENLGSELETKDHYLKNLLALEKSLALHEIWKIKLKTHWITEMDGYIRGYTTSNIHNQEISFFIMFHLWLQCLWDDHLFRLWFWFFLRGHLSTKGQSQHRNGSRNVVEAREVQGGWRYNTRQAIQTTPTV